MELHVRMLVGTVLASHRLLERHPSHGASMSVAGSSERLAVTWLGSMMAK
jgi:hypothetical protein